MDIETVLLKSLFCRKDYAKKTVRTISYTYFEDDDFQLIFEVFQKYYFRYGNAPSFRILKLFFTEKSSKIAEARVKSLIIKLNQLEEIEYNTDDYPLDWLIDETEDWLIKRSVYSAIMKSVIIYDEKPEDIGTIPGIIQKALQVSLFQTIGHDYFKGSRDRHQFYSQGVPKFATHLDNFNRATGGGFEKKTLNVILGQPNSGKSRLLVDFAAHYIRVGMNILYISLELGEEKVGQRFDANLLDYPINEMKNIKEELFIRKFKKLRDAVKGRLFIKEYPTAAANVNHFRSLLEELKIKKDFVPEIIIVDYLNIAAPIRFGNSSDIYNYLKGVSEEFRGLAAETNTILLTAAQLNRPGWYTTDVNMRNIAECAVIAHVSDFIGAIIVTEEFQEDNQILFKVLKNRLYKMSAEYDRFFLGYDDDKMTHYDINLDSREGIEKSTKDDKKIKKKDRNFSEFKFTE